MSFHLSDLTDVTGIFIKITTTKTSLVLPLNPIKIYFPLNIFLAIWYPS